MWKKTAIARIDRMSQQHETEVYCYYAEGTEDKKLHPVGCCALLTPALDTVERNILDLAARQGLSLYTKDNAAGTLNVSSFTFDAEKPSQKPSTRKRRAQQVQKGDFIFKCVFSLFVEGKEILLTEWLVD
jgi:E3 ubiquitin-protein ligase SHPRH